MTSNFVKNSRIRNVILENKRNIVTSVVRS